MNMWRQKGKFKISRRRILLVALLIVACIFAIFHLEYLNQIIVVATIVGLFISYLQLSSSKETRTKTQDTEENPLTSDTTPPAINQPSQETHARIASTQLLKNEPAPVGRASGQVVTKPLHAISSFYNPEDIFHFNQKLLKASDFYGRKSAIMTLLDRTRKRNSTSIVGPGLIGKSWLVEYLHLVAKRDIGPNVCLGLIDARSASCSSIEGFIEQAVLKLDGSLDPQHAHSDLAFLEKTVEKLMKNNRHPILCIDKFEGFSNRKAFDLSFFTQLRAIAQKGLVLVTVSKVPLIDIIGDYGRTSGLFNIIEQITLKPFTQEEAEEFVAAKNKHAGFTLEEQRALLFYGQTEKEQWLPIRLQLAGKELLSDKIYHIASYQPEDRTYWQHFKQSIDDKYRGIGG